MNRKPYFIPSVYQNKTSYDKVVRAGRSIEIPQEPVKEQPTASKPKRRKKAVPKGAAQMPAQGAQAPPAGVLLQSDVCDDNAQRRILHCLQAMATRHPLGMFILSQLNFGDYLNEPSYAAAAKQFPRPMDLKKMQKDQGDFDILGIIHDYGFLVAEIKSVGDRFHEPLHDKAFQAQPGQSQPPTQAQQDVIVAKKVQQAIKQLDKTEYVLRHLAKDLPAQPRVTKTIMLPNISRAQLERVFNANSALEQVGL